MIRSLAALVLALASLPAIAREPAKSPDEQVLALLKEDLDALRRADPIGASNRGDRRFDAELPDVSPAGMKAFDDACGERLNRANALRDADLSEARRTDLELLIYDLALRIEGSRFMGWEAPISQVNGPQYDLPQLPQQLSFTSDRQLDDYVSRLEKIPAYIEQTIANMRRGLKDGRTPPKIIMGAVAEQAALHSSEAIKGDPANHALYPPLAGAPAALREQGAKVIRDQIAPAYSHLAAFLRDEYVPHCRETLAATAWPDGAAYYNHQIKVQSTLDITADEVHATGLGEVKRIRGEMMEVIARSDFGQKDTLKGDELFAAFIHYLRTDPRFYVKTPEELLKGYRDVAKRIDAELPHLFRVLPRLPYGVREMPRFIAPSSPTAYYFGGSLANGVAGFFIANTTSLDQRPTYERIPLTLHEAVPGHHLQISLAQELTDVPEWRTNTGYTGFVEGWGLYSEKLGLEMGDDARSASNPKGHGLFTDPYDDFGRLSYEIWRAMRLVVDTGIHSKGWTRDQAISFMESNSALSRTNIEREVDRYIAWPGQAVGYKLGELRLLALRAHAQQVLGSRFDVRSFHQAVLGQGAVPLPVLSEQVERWIQKTLKE